MARVTWSTTWYGIPEGIRNRINIAANAKLEAIRRSVTRSRLRQRRVGAMDCELSGAGIEIAIPRLAKEEQTLNRQESPAIRSIRWAASAIAETPGEGRDELAEKGPTLFSTEGLTWNTQPPVMPDEQGSYAHLVPTPGIYKLPYWSVFGGIDLDFPLDDLKKQTRNHVSSGFRPIKMKVGRDRISEDVERVATIRELIGPYISLMVDANMGGRVHQPPSALLEQFVQGLPGDTKIRGEAIAHTIRTPQTQTHNVGKGPAKLPLNPRNFASDRHLGLSGSYDGSPHTEYDYDSAASDRFLNRPREREK